MTCTPISAERTHISYHKGIGKPVTSWFHIQGPVTAVNFSPSTEMMSHLILAVVFSTTVGLLRGELTPHIGRFERGPQQLDALRQPSL